MFFYKIGYLGICFNIGFELIESNYYDKFRITQTEYEKLEKKQMIDFHVQKPLIIEFEKIIYETSSKVIGFYDNNLVTYYHRYPNNKYYCSFVRNNNSKNGVINLSPDCLEYLSQTSDLFDLVDVVSMLLNEKMFILHSSFLIYNNQALLFCGPSGIGKSTQANLWEKYKYAEIVNGDRSLICKKEEEWRVYSVPNCGSSNICENKNAKLAGIVLLQQGDENVIITESFFVMFKQIFMQVIFNRFKEEECDCIIKLLELLIVEIPVIKLSCLPNKESVELVEKFLNL